MSPWNEQGLRTSYTTTAARTITPEEELKYYAAWDDHPDFAELGKKDEADRRRHEARSYEHGKWERATERGLEPRSVLDMVKDYPNEVADFLEQLGYDVEGLMNDMGWPSVH